MLEINVRILEFIMGIKETKLELNLEDFKIKLNNNIKFKLYKMKEFNFFYKDNYKNM
jgi:hypothetical protein